MSGDKRYTKRKFKKVVVMIVNEIFDTNEVLSRMYDVYPLNGEYEGCKCCHLFDLVLIWTWVLEENEKVLYLVDIGTHQNTVWESFKNDF